MDFLGWPTRETCVIAKFIAQEEALERDFINFAARTGDKETIERHIKLKIYDLICRGVEEGTVADSICHTFLDDVDFESLCRHFMRKSQDPTVTKTYDVEIVSSETFCVRVKAGNKGEANIEAHAAFEEARSVFLSPALSLMNRNRGISNDPDERETFVAECRIVFNKKAAKKKTRKSPAK